MKNFNWLLLAIFGGMILIACEPKLSGSQVRLSITTNMEDSSTVWISYYPSFEMDTLIKARLDSNGQAFLQFDLKRPVMAYLEVGKFMRGKLFLSPGDDLAVKIVVKGSDRFLTMSFTGNGNGAHINNYINKVIAMSYKTTTPAVWNKDVKGFLYTYDSLSSQVSKFSAHFIDSISLPRQEQSLFLKSTEMALLNVKLWYAYQLHTQFLVDQIYAYRERVEVHLTDNNFLAGKTSAFQEGEEGERFTMPPEFKGLFDQIPFDTTFFEMPMHEYDGVLFTYLMEKYYNSVFDPVAWDKPDPLLPLKTNNALKNGQYPNTIKELLIAMNLRHFMSERGITPILDSLFSEFKRTHSNSIHLKNLQEV